MRFPAILAALILACATAHAAPVDGVSITMHGAPACAKRNATPDIVSGTFRARLPDLDGNLHGSTNPWGQWRLPQFRGATYGAVFGASNAPTLVVYFFPTPQASMTLVWGTPDWFNNLVFKFKGNVVATVNGADVAAAFGFQTGLNLTLTLPGGQKFDQVTFQSEGTAFEFANLNATCP